MKIKTLFLLLIFIPGIYSCKKDKADSMIPQTFAPNYRDTVIASYHGITRHVKRTHATLTVVGDTSYPDSVTVIKDLYNDSFINLNYHTVQLKADYTFVYNSPVEGYVGAFFLFNDSISTELYSSSASYNDQYSFRGNK
jgi:hypothetical protein